MGSFLVTLDCVSYKLKPTKYEVCREGGITRRMQQAGPTECDAAMFCEHVRHGKTWAGGCYKPNSGGWGEFEGMQLFALDFDNKSGKRPLREGEAGYLDPVAALDRCEEMGLQPLCLYFTMSARCPDLPKYRLVFDMGRPLDKEEAKAALSALMEAFGEVDTQCSNLNRLFFGSGGEVWECWRVWGGE